MTDEESAKAKLAKVAVQVNRMNTMGEQFDMDCPYCGALVSVGATFCCSTLLNAVGVIVEASDRFNADLMKHMVN